MRIGFNSTKKNLIAATTLLRKWESFVKSWKEHLNPSISKLNSQFSTAAISMQFAIIPQLFDIHSLSVSDFRNCDATTSINHYNYTERSDSGNWCEYPVTIANCINLLFTWIESFNFQRLLLITKSETECLSNCWFFIMCRQKWAVGCSSWPNSIASNFSDMRQFSRQ